MIWHRALEENAWKHFQYIGDTFNPFCLFSGFDFSVFWTKFGSGDTDSSESSSKSAIVTVSPDDHSESWEIDGPLILI